MPTRTKPNTATPTPSLADVLCNLRDCGLLDKHSLLLMTMLSLRVNPAEGWYCSPSYQQLRDDTQLSSGSVLRAVRDMVEKNLLRRSIRPQQSNVFRINIELLGELAAMARAKVKAQAVVAIDYLAPWDATIDKVQSKLEAAPPASPSYSGISIGTIDTQRTERFLNEIPRAFHEHTQVRTGALNRDHLRIVLERCSALAGGLSHVKKALVYVWHSRPEIAEEILQSCDLVSYLDACLPLWVDRFGTVADAYVASLRRDSAPSTDSEEAAQGAQACLPK